MTLWQMRREQLYILLVCFQTSSWALPFFLSVKYNYQLDVYSVFKFKKYVAVVHFKETSDSLSFGKTQKRCADSYFL